MIFKKIFIVIAACFTLSFISIPAFAESSTGDISHGGSDHGGGGSGSDRNETNSSGNDISIPFTFLGHSYNFSIPFPSSFMSIVRDIIFYFLLIKSVYSKFKALPAIIGQVPVIGPSDSQQVAMYNNIYGR